jgi:hypothetical protein
MGGRESVNNIKKFKIKEHIALIADLTGGVWGSINTGGSYGKNSSDWNTGFWRFN